MCQNLREGERESTADIPEFCDNCDHPYFIIDDGIDWHAECNSCGRVIENGEVIQEGNLREGFSY